MATMLPVTVTLKKEDGQLVTTGGLADKLKSENFVKNLKEGQLVLLTYEEKTELGSYAQLSKIHACIREISKDTGTDFEDMKDIIKHKMKLKDENEKNKSFADYTKDEMSDAISMVIKIGEGLGISL